MNRQLHPSYSEPTHAILYVWFNPMKGESFGDWGHRVRKALEDAGFELDGAEHEDFGRVASENPIPKHVSRVGEVAEAIGAQQEGATPSALTNFPVEQLAGTAGGAECKTETLTLPNQRVAEPLVTAATGVGLSPLAIQSPKPVPPTPLRRSGEPSTLSAPLVLPNGEMIYAI